MGSSWHPARLSATFVKGVTAPGRYGDGRGGNGLSLLVKPTSNGRVSRTWAQRLRIHSRPVNVGLGAFPAISLAEAREKAAANVKVVAEGNDPRIKPTMVPTLEEALEKTITILRPDWKEGSKTEGTLRRIVRLHVPKSLLIRPVDRIDTNDILDFLAPLALEKPETARKGRVFLGQIFKWAVAKGYRLDDPTDARINRGLPKRAEGKHHRSLEYPYVPRVIDAIRASNAWPATKLGLEFLICTLARSGEVRHATWDEISAGGLLWTLPPERMKSGRKHAVPVAAHGLGVLCEAAIHCGGREGLIFPSPKGTPLSDATFSKLLSDLGFDCVPHGFRRTFRNWAHQTGEDGQLAEEALAHAKGDKTETSYLTDDAIQRRQSMMYRWQKWCSDPLPCSV